MSAPVGYLKAEIYGLPFIFDGENWSIPEVPQQLKYLLDEVVRRLQSERSRVGIHNHMPLGIRAEKMLEYAQGPSDGWNWKIVDEKPHPDWDQPRPPGFY